MLETFHPYSRQVVGGRREEDNIRVCLLKCLEYSVANDPFVADEDFFIKSERHRDDIRLTVLPGPFYRLGPSQLYLLPSVLGKI